MSGSAPLAGIRVLLVDDEPDCLSAACLLLEMNGAEVVAVLSARQAREALQSFPADVLVSDLSMPGEDGFSLMASVAGLTPHPAALALTARHSPDDQARALASGFSRYLTKPVDPDVLVRTVAALAAA